MTEKYFKVLPYNVIPIVLNGANMSKLAPPHSYINVQDFTSTQHLAEYLNMINNNDTLFASYFWWRDHYEVQVTSISHFKITNKIYFLPGKS